MMDPQMTSRRDCKCKNSTVGSECDAIAVWFQLIGTREDIAVSCGKTKMLWLHPVDCNTLSSVLTCKVFNRKCLLWVETTGVKLCLFVFGSDVDLQPFPDDCILPCQLHSGKLRMML